MTRRNLTPEEKTIMLKQQIRLRETIADNKKEFEICEFKLDVEIPFNIKKRNKEIQYQMKKNEGTIVETEAILKIIDDQIKNGVEVKAKEEVPAK